MSAPVQVPDKVLSWLYGSLTNEYYDPGRVYSDVAKTLSFHPSLSPRTDIFTYENGASALLLRLHGTLPVTFRGTGYKFPMSIWLPHAYPREPPMPYFTPDQNLAIRPGSHVSTEGRVYHPYLAQWSNHWDKSNLIDCLAIFQSAFAKEPPLVARPPHDPGSSPQASDSSALAQGTAFAPPASTGDTRRPQAVPPPPPPKPPEARGIPAVSNRPDVSNKSHAPEAPPRPPKSGQALTPPFPNPVIHRTPPLPSHTSPHGIMHTETSSPAPSSLSHNRSSINGVLQHAYQPVQGPYELNMSSSPEYRHEQSTPTHLMSARGAQSTQSPRAQQVSYLSHAGAAPPATNQQKQPTLDLLSLPLDMTFTSQASQDRPISAPPIPPNPEKDALLRAISLSLRAQVEQAVAQTRAAIPALEAQQTALHYALQNMQAEKYQLDELNKMLGRNEKILHDSMLEADRVVDGVKRRELPPVDEVLVAPSVVGEQLYKLAADERSIGDALFALTKALDRGRISSDVFLKQTRSLAREQFLHKALTKKVVRGMGLVVDTY